jgi:hypothetical protein
MIPRVQLLPLLAVLCILASVIQATATQKFTLYHQLLHSESSNDITPRGIINYDPSTQSATYEKQSDVVDLTTGDGFYRIGFLDAMSQALSPAAFTRRVFPSLFTN